ncbi:non-ribosomal peptide synthetase [Mucilaginibacter pedocola]|uniref:Carrier domain-containing protein n=1 Tax=Mucilaginibacter pedocola TaxID=1792845 RepID=A0A1S9PKT6_9SPHI|nr:non-ribosomal peptide synthetase [Mucilaginibacter pedocola]OOQ61561.1 hypothetical protein BC343_00330 [Mucilaginibacter pedocola]
MNYEANPVEFDPFAGPQIALMGPATEPQIEIWTSCLIGGGDASCAYNDAGSILLTGPFNKDAMFKALQALSDRHESLRTVFTDDGQHFLVLDNPKLVIEYHDISYQTEAQNKLFIENYTRQNAITPLDLVNGPLFKPSIIKLADQVHYLTFIAHHIICDGWSIGVMMQEMSKLYTAFAKGEWPSLPSAARYSDYAAEQTAFAETAESREIEQYWLNQFKGSSHLLNVPTDNPRPAMRTYKSKRLDFTLDELLVKEVKQTARKAGASFVTMLMAAFEVYLQQITGHEEIILGLPAAGQSATGNYGLVGHCVNLLALRSYPKGEQSFIAYLKERNPQVMDAYDHQLYTFGSLLKKLNIPRDASRLPLVPVVFNIDIGMDEGISFHGLKHEYITTGREYENFEIFLNITDHKNALVLEWSYNTQIFEAATIKRMMDEYTHLLRQIVRSPEKPIGKLPQMRAEELMTLLNEWNDTSVPYPKEKPLHQIISEIASRSPNAVALKFQNEIYSYRQLNERANQLAAVLVEGGVQVGDKIAVSLDRAAELVVSLLAVMKAGGVYVPLDPIFPINRINYMLADSEAVKLITSRKYSGMYESDAEELLLHEIWTTLDSKPKTDPKVAVSGQDLLYILYTSGSTGQPKGVQIAHHNCVNFLYSMQKQPGMTPADKLLAVTTISFDIAGLELFLPLITGSQIILVDAATAKDGVALLDIIRREKITVMQATPYTWRILLEAGWDLEKIKVICGGEALPLDLATRILERASSLWNVYGPTETTIWSTIKQITPNDEFISIGKPIDNTYIYILDKFQNPLAPGAAGEIYIGGEGVAKGYHDQPILTYEKFVEDPFVNEPGAMMYRTGDLGKYLPDGNLMYISRIDAQVKIRGYRIETGEIEFHMGKDPDLKQVVVIARPDSNGVDKLVAYVVFKEEYKGNDFNQCMNYWRSELRGAVPDYMIPDNFIRVDEMPLTPNGKVDKKALAAIGVIPAEIHDLYIEPRTDVEKLVADIWKEYLNVEKVGVYDNFFELGGHSLIAVKVMARIEKETGKRLPLAILFENSTVEKLSLVLGMDGRSITWDSLVPVKPKGNKMPIYIVHGAGLNVLLFNTLANHMDPDQPVYGMQAKGLNGIDEPLNRMEDIAAHYVASIRAQNPNGPYALAGFSFGGIIAWEMAKQMEALNLEVRMLAMFDTYAYRTPYYDPWLINKVKRGMYLGRRLWYSMTFQEGFAKTVEHRAKAVSRIAQRLIWKLKFGNQEEQPTGFFGYSHKIDQMNDVAQRHYKIEPYPICVELFRAEVRSFYLDDYEYLGWKPFALKGVTIHKIPGEHNTIFKSPNDKEFARILQACLDKASAKKSDKEEAK